MRKIIIHSSRIEEELERQHRMQLMENLFRRADAAFYEPSNEEVKRPSPEKILIQLRTAVDCIALAIFLLGEIVAGAYLTINRGLIPVVIFSIPCVIILPFLAESFALLIVGTIIAFFLFLFLLFLINQATLSFAYDGISVFVDVIINISWGFAYIFASIGWYLIVKKLSQTVQYIIETRQYKAEETRRKQEAEAKAKAKTKAEEERRKHEEERIRQRANQAQARAKVEEARIMQEKLKQQEYRNHCKEFVNNFWNEFFDSDEETDALLSRLRFALENSGYRNWKTEFYDKVVAKVKTTTRPPKSARSQQQSHATDENLGGLKMYFNGVWLTPTQYQILSRYPQIKNLYDEDLLTFCRKLAEKIPEFANFKQATSGMCYYPSDEVYDACRFMDVKYEDLSEESLKKAYRRLSLQYHPDRNKSANAAEMFSKLQKSHEILKKALLHKAS